MTQEVGIEEALKRIDSEIESIKDVSQAAFWEAGLKIINKSMKKVPADTGNLRASAYVRAPGKSTQPGGGSPDPEDTMPADEPPALGVELGYYAHYALNVHEMVEQKLKGQPRENFGETSEGVAFGGGTGKGEYWDTGEPKFLESVVIENRDAIARILRERTARDLAKRNPKK